jgi:hypothetical protein
MISRYHIIFWEWVTKSILGPRFGSFMTPIWDTDLEPQFKTFKKVNVEATIQMILISYHLKNNNIHLIVYNILAMILIWYDIQKKMILPTSGKKIDTPLRPPLKSRPCAVHMHFKLSNIFRTRFFEFFRIFFEKDNV